jgi:hypothetical protein
MRYIAPIVGLALVLILSPAATARADDDGIVRIKCLFNARDHQAHQKDVADKGIMFFDEIDQSKLADGGDRLDYIDRSVAMR